MARNEEKLFGRLNRLHLQKQIDAELLKNPRRPALSSLTRAQEIKKWIPSISRDLDISLKQITVPCYPERVISDVQDRIARLEKEYKAFTRKLKDLDPEYSKETASNPRTYSVATKRSYSVGVAGGDECSPNGQHSTTIVDESNVEQMTTADDKHKFVSDFLASRIKLRILDGDAEHQYANISHIYNGAQPQDCPDSTDQWRVETERNSFRTWSCNVNVNTQDAPLEFRRPGMVGAPGGCRTKYTKELLRSSRVDSHSLTDVMCVDDEAESASDVIDRQWGSGSGLQLLTACYTDSSDNDDVDN